VIFFLKIFFLENIQTIAPAIALGFALPAFLFMLLIFLFTEAIMLFTSSSLKY
jgi:hypothetical protein